MIFRSAFVAVNLLALFSQWASAAPYTFTLIAASTESEEIASFKPTINNSGSVAYTVATPGLMVNGVKVGDGISTTTIANLFGQFSAIRQGAFISDSGDVAFRAHTVTGFEGVYRSDGTTTVTIADTSGSFGNLGSDVAINAAGEVAFLGTGEFNPTAFSGIYVGDGMGVSVIDSTSASAASNFADDPSINDAGQVAYVRRVGATDRELLLGDGSSNFLIADTLGELQGFGDFAVNAAGQIIFNSGLDSGGQTLRIGDGSSQMELANTEGSFSQFTHPSINSSSDIAFLGHLDDGGIGVFGGTDPVADLLVESGDILFGKTILNLAVSSYALNDLGQITFGVLFTDRSRAIVRADPTAAPEPATLAIFAIGLAGLGFLRRRSRTLR